MDLQALFAPFPPDRVEWRAGNTTKDKTRCMALAYIDARDVMERLDAVCGPENWQNRYTHAETKTICEIGIRVDGEWIWKSNGAGDTQFEAEKGAISDAFKRAAVQWGIGRYLYDVKAPWVECEAFGKSIKIKDSELPKLRAVLGEAPAQETRPPTREQKIISSRKAGKRFGQLADSKAALETALNALLAANTGAEIDLMAKENARTLNALMDDHYAEFVIAMNDRKKALPAGFPEAA